MRSRNGGHEPAVRLEAGRVVAIFTRQGDRWRHAILVDGDCRYESLEGPQAPAADPRWPAAPVLSELSLIDVEQGPAIGGVGRAGRSHFSLSMTVHPRLPDTLCVEVACRIHEPPGWLGSTYRELGRSPGMEPRPVWITAPAGESDPPALPRTVAWSYLIGTDGIGGLGAAGRKRADDGPPGLR